MGRTLRRRGHEVRVIAPCDGPPPELFVTPIGKSIPTASNGSIAPVAPDPSAQLRTIRALWDEDFDVVHLHEPFAPGPTITTAMLKPAPLVGTFHAAGDQPYYKRLAGLASWGARRLDVRVAVSEDAVELIQGLVEGEVHVLFNGIEAERFRDAEPWPSGGPTVLFIGRHEERKGLEVLLRALEYLPEDLTIWVAGEGPETQELKAKYGDRRIEWLGRIEDDERDRRMKGASVFCAPSLGGESFGIILLEAMAARTPVVASAIPGYSKVATTQHGLAAELVETGDAAALAEGIGRVLSDQSYRSELI
ncbi:MAG: glycosyltransferase family 4 protein [Microthrixaceae bacterium]|nr:glycosyltransferase family 4 protein [Microthrixaceae bacterium]